MKKILLPLLAAAFVVFSFSPVDQGKGNAAKSENDSLTALRIHRSILTVDPHIDILTDFNKGQNDAGKETPSAFDLPKLERGGLDVATLALAVSTAKRTPENVAAARQEVDNKLASIRTFVSQHPDRLELASNAADLERIAAKGKHAILLSFLNAYSLGKDLTQLPVLHKEGVRVFGFVHAGNNDFADSSRPNAALGDKPDEAGGLTAVGKQAVGELNRLGVVIDVSQLTPAGVLQTLQLSKAPVIASHSGVRGRVENTRNLTNEELKAIAKGGGVVHIVAFPAYLRDNPQLKADYLKTIWEPFGLTPGKDDPKEKLDAASYEKFQQTYRAFSAGGWKYATLVDYLDAVDYAVRLIGIDHVGLSSDFNHGGGVTGYANVGEAPNVTRELLKRGYSEANIRKLWGGNFLRVFKQVEASAKQVPSSTKVTAK